MTIGIIITDSAFRRVGELSEIEAEGNNFLRISVDGGGCSGFAYKYDMVSNSEKDDLIFEKNGVKVFIDPMSAEYMQGSSVDFIEELGASYFSIKNPQAKSKCGCGSSFSI